MELALPAALATGALAGLALAAPVGPIGVLVIERSLRQGLAAGLATGLGAAVADAVYGALGVFAAAAVLALLASLRQPLAVAGALLLLWLAWRTWRGAGTAVAGDGAGPGALPAVPAADLRKAFVGTLLLTLANPATVLTFVALMGALAGRLAAPIGPAAAAALVLGVGLGSAAWWLLLAGAVSRFRHRLDTRQRVLVARVSALLLLGFAAWSLSALFRRG
jgi:threonine/homoserine/homoserine lactone efflux protein